MTGRTVVGYIDQTKSRVTSNNIAGTRLLAYTLLLMLLLTKT
jgi:hypothetical protein